MLKDYDISIIIPFYQRDEYAIKTYKILQDQAEKFSINIEVIFVDSKSRTNLEDELRLLPHKKNSYFKIFDTRDYVSVKRNFGIEVAKSDKIIVIDDDCMPYENFLIEHYNSLCEIKNSKKVLCGIIKYEDHLIRESNYFRYREQKHRRYDKLVLKSKNLDFHNIIVMNMSFYKEQVVNNDIYFNEKFNSYGFEDIQFGIDLISKGFKIGTTKAAVFHRDSDSISIYYKKLLSFGKTYLNLFYNYNKDRLSYQKNSNNVNIYTKERKGFDRYKVLLFLAEKNNLINRNQFINFFFKIVVLIIKLINKCLIKYFIYTDNKRIFFSKHLFNIFILLAFLETFFDKQEINKDWL